MARDWTSLSDDELDRQIEEARQRSKIADETEPRAASARYNRKTGRVEIELRDGWLFGFPADSAQGLQGATAEQLARVEVIGNGYALHWEDLDADFTVPGLLAGRLGSRVWMREHARRAGSVTSEAKAQAARINGAKGGRPRKTAAGTGKKMAQDSHTASGQARARTNVASLSSAEKREKGAAGRAGGAAKKPAQGGGKDVSRATAKGGAAKQPSGGTRGSGASSREK